MLLGMDTEFKELDIKALSAIDTTLFGIDTEVKAQDLKAYSPIAVTVYPFAVDGIVIELLYVDKIAGEFNNPLPT
jgi:hypothetical protein